MRKLTFFLILLLCSSPNAQREAYVVNGLAETLSLIDLESGLVANHIAILGETPNQVAFYDNYLYVVNSISADVMKINSSSHQIEFTYLLPVGSNPYNIAFYGNYAYVTGWVSGKVYRLNLVTNTIDGDLEIGGYPEGLLCRDNYLYVTQTYFDPNNFSYGQGKVARIELSGFSFVSDHNVGKNPQWISRAPDGMLHIVCTGNYDDVEGSVYIFDPGSGVAIDSVLIGGQPSRLAISPTGIGYLSAGGWSANGYVYSYDIFSGDIIRGPSNPIMVGLGASSIAADSLGYVYSCNFGDDTVSKIDFSGNVIGSYGLGDGPLSITIIDDTAIGIEEERSEMLPETAYLIKSYPNPFNAGTVIKLHSYDSGPRERDIGIFDISGRLIKALYIETLDGYGEVYWDGTDNGNSGCASGIYFVKIMGAEGNTNKSDRLKTLKTTLMR
ncbi:MAG: T9SS type A sorting domain-containing protein [Candidatus Zixiibacteriota bacterium]|nr:MAG: T9SS type A sorting domain-containing protein [candidate division Zixibacteria bacterium]